MEILLWLALASLPLGVVLAVAGAVVAVVLKGRIPAVALAALVPVLLVVWASATYQDGIRADETGTSGNIFVAVGWLVAAAGAGAGAACLAVVRAARASHEEVVRSG
ncbi:hypothetical protein [Amnibacterium endophyticum]|uniref:Uncharacterized protein n=1 Tax=Amnibacterium endophyticum TaxID=2109337 RepID=A0ABW4LFQ2_9MICO